jgi:hypothetical protein
MKPNDVQMVVATKQEMEGEGLPSKDKEEEEQIAEAVSDASPLSRDDLIALAVQNKK